MIVRLLGTAAGAGFPLENCNCRACRMAREGSAQAAPRAPFCVALSAEGENWFLLNAPFHLKNQMESFTPLAQGNGRGPGRAIQAVLATCNDMERVAGLPELSTREPVVLYVPMDGAGMELDRSRVEPREVPGRPVPLLLRNGKTSGLLFCAFPAPFQDASRKTAAVPSLAFGYRFRDVRTGGKLVVLPNLSRADGTVQRQMEDCDALLLDGTFWDPMEPMGNAASPRPLPLGNHWVVGGAEGSLETLKGLACRYKVYIHLSHTNPMLIEGSPTATQVRSAGGEVGRDGMEFMI